MYLKSMLAFQVALSGGDAAGELSSVTPVLGGAATSTVALGELRVYIVREGCKCVREVDKSATPSPENLEGNS